MESRLLARREEEEPAGLAPAATDLPEEDSAPIGPTEEEESAFLANENAMGNGDAPDGRTRMAGGIALPAAGEEDEPVGGLPAMEALVKRIPAEVLSTMDELFRAKFATVQRVPKKSLKRESSA